MDCLCCDHHFDTDTLISLFLLVVWIDRLIIHSGKSPLQTGVFIKS